LQKAEQQYGLDKNTKKSDPPRFYAARDAVMAARRTFNMKTGVISLQVTEKRVRDEEVEKRREAATPAGQAAALQALVQQVIRLERAYRLSLDHQECVEGIWEGQALPGATILPLLPGTPAFSIFVHQHSVYRAMLSVLVTGGPAGLKDAWEEWGRSAQRDAARRGDALRYLTVTTESTFVQVQTASGKDGYMEHFETYRVPLSPEPATLHAPVKIDRRRAHAERVRIAEGRPKRGRGRPAKS
jgi:hypothetical protein